MFYGERSVFPGVVVSVASRTVLLLVMREMSTLGPEGSWSLTDWALFVLTWTAVCSSPAGLIGCVAV